jgi:alpha/beta superfamily hydrolase
MQARTIRFRVREGLSLEGRLTEAGERAALVAPPHPLYGGSIGNPVVRALEGALLARGMTTLAFNFRGIGESEGDPSGDLGCAVQDMLAAAQALDGRTISWLTGYSFGGVTALASAPSLGAVSCLVVAPPAAMLVAEYFAVPQRSVVIAGRDDAYAPEARLQEAIEKSPVELRILAGVDHFFLGSHVLKLAQTLTDLAL